MQVERFSYDYVAGEHVSLDLRSKVNCSDPLHIVQIRTQSEAHRGIAKVISNEQPVFEFFLDREYRNISVLTLYHGDIRIEYCNELLGNHKIYIEIWFEIIWESEFESNPSKWESITSQSYIHIIRKDASDPQFPIYEEFSHVVELFNESIELWFSIIPLEGTLEIGDFNAQISTANRIYSTISIADTSTIKIPYPSRTDQLPNEPITIKFIPMRDPVILSVCLTIIRIKRRSQS